MAKPSSSKKIQKVQQAGVTRVAGQRRQLGFPAAIIGIIVVGLIAVWFARDARINADGDLPRPNQDSWYEAYGLYKCDAYQANPPAPEGQSDISTPGNGLISIFPTSDETGGDNATLGKFFDAIGLEATNDAITLSDGTELKAGDECGVGNSKTTDTEIVLYIWPPQASEVTEPRIITENFGDVQFDESNALYALALVESGTENIDLPSSASNLANPTAGIPVTDVETTVPPEETAPTEDTVPAEDTDPAEDTAPAEDPTTTEAG